MARKLPLLCREPQWTTAQPSEYLDNSRNGLTPSGLLSQKGKDTLHIYLLQKDGLLRQGMIEGIHLITPEGQNRVDKDTKGRCSIDTLQHGIPCAPLLTFVGCVVLPLLEW